MHEINLSADELVSILLNLENERNLCLLDSCGVSHLNSHFLIAGIDPVELFEINELSAEKTLKLLDEKLSQKNLAAMLTISYDFGLKLNKISPRTKEFPSFHEPDVFLALFDALIIHDYNLQKTFLTGNESKFTEIEKFFNSHYSKTPENSESAKVSSNFTRKEYLSAIEEVQEFIRCGDTYQTNLTQKIYIELPENLKPAGIFSKLRKKHPAPFAAFLQRLNDVVISASPERFFKVQNFNFASTENAFLQSSASESQPTIISVSPIKGTRPRGKTLLEDDKLRNELLNSEKDRAENIMIVDLLRNDVGKVCEFGSVKVEKLCDLEEHPSLFHLVSTVSGKLKDKTAFSDILRAVFPCGSITGAPKIRTMQIIDALETASRGLSMGAIGFVLNNSKFKIHNSLDSSENPQLNDDWLMDFSVAIRTMVVRDRQAVFNVGGGITIDSVAAEEYDESLVKAQALLNSINT